MNLVHIQQIDLNLLVLFQVLMEELHVTRAAKKLGLSQSAFSHALARLRDSVGDPLFIRTPQGMQPTRRAEQMIGGVRKALHDLQTTLTTDSIFDPATCTDTIRISIDDYLGQTLGVDLARKLTKIAPNLRVEFTSLREELPMEEFRKGTLQFAVRVGVTAAPGVYKKKIFTDDFICLVDNNHPKIRRSLTLKHYVEHKHLLVAPLGGFSGTVDGELEKLGLNRQVQVSMVHFSMAPWLLLNSEHVLTLPRSIAERFATYLPIKLLPPPLDLPGFNVDLLWHERDHNDPLSRWVRSVIMQDKA